MSHMKHCVPGSVHLVLLMKKEKTSADALGAPAYLPILRHEVIDEDGWGMRAQLLLNAERRCGAGPAR